MLPMLQTATAPVKGCKRKNSDCLRCGRRFGKREWLCPFLRLPCYFISHFMIEFPSLEVLRSTTPAEEQAAAVKQLIERFVGKRATEFAVSVIHNNSSYLDDYEVRNVREF